MKINFKVSAIFALVAMVLAIFIWLILGHLEEREWESYKEKERIAKEIEEAARKRRNQVRDNTALKFPSKWDWTRLPSKFGQWLTPGQLGPDGNELVMTRAVNILTFNEERVIKIEGGELSWTFRQRAACKPDASVELFKEPDVELFKEPKEAHRLGMHYEEKELLSYPYKCDATGEWRQLGPLKIDARHFGGPSHDPSLLGSKGSELTFVDKNRLIRVKLNEILASFDVEEIRRIIRQQKLEALGF